MGRKKKVLSNDDINTIYEEIVIKGNSIYFVSKKLYISYSTAQRWIDFYIKEQSPEMYKEIKRKIYENKNRYFLNTKDKKTVSLTFYPMTETPRNNSIIIAYSKKFGPLVYLYDLLDVELAKYFSNENDFFCWSYLPETNVIFEQFQNDLKK